MIKTRFSPVNVGTMCTRSQTRAAVANVSINSPPPDQPMVKQRSPKHCAQKRSSHIKQEVLDTKDVGPVSRKDSGILTPTATRCTEPEIIILDDDDYDPAVKRRRGKSRRSTIPPPGGVASTDVPPTSLSRTAGTNSSVEIISVKNESNQLKVKPPRGKSRAPNKTRSTPSSCIARNLTSAGSPATIATNSPARYPTIEVPIPAKKAREMSKVGTAIVTSPIPEFLPLKGQIVVFDVNDSERLVSLKALVTKLGGTSSDFVPESRPPNLIVSDHITAKRLEHMKTHQAMVTVCEEFVGALPAILRHAVRLKVRVRFVKTFEDSVDVHTRKAEDIRSKPQPHQAVGGVVSLSSPFIKIEDDSRKYRPIYKELDPTGKNYAHVYFGQFLGASLFHKATAEMQEKRSKEIEQEKMNQKKLESMLANGDDGYPANLFPPTRPRPIKEVTKGFCEICAKHTHNVKEHVGSSAHQAMINAPGFYTEVDAVLGSFVEEISCPGLPQLEREEPGMVSAAPINVNNYEFCEGSYRRRNEASNQLCVVRDCSLLLSMTSLKSSGLEKNNNANMFFDVDMEDLFKQQVSRIEVMCTNGNAVIDVVACHTLADPLAQPPAYRFQVLLSFLISSHTKDEISSAAFMRLRTNGCSVDSMLAISTAELEKLLHPVAFYKMKSVFIQKLARILKYKYNGDVPDQYEDLCKLPGIDPKMAQLIRREAWGRVEGIAVDTRVHKIVNRLGWMKTATPEATRAKLESMLPRTDWNTINDLLVAFGQKICLPVKPNCAQCLCQDICPASSYKLTKTIRDLLPLVAKKKDIDAAKKLVNYSHDLSRLYYDVLVINLKLTFGCNLEKSLWNQGFHQIIDCLKTAINSTHPNVKHLRAVFLEFLSKSIDYFQSLVDLYETKYHFSLTEILQYWSNGLPNDDFKSVVGRNNVANNQLAVKSCSRLLVSLGDLHRYQTLVNGLKDYSISRSFYLKSAYLWPSSGHVYNQLAVVAYFSERVLDEIYYSIRAISAQYSFETSKERLYTRFGAIRKKVSKYEQLLNNEMGVVIGESEIAVHADRPRELWVAVDGVAEPDKSIYSSYLQQDPCQLHRRVISYLVDAAGLLLTKIGMDQFWSVSERAMSQLAALITMVDSPMTAQQLIQCTIVFIYVAHSTAKRVAEVDTISLQHQLAMQTVISFFGALLQPISTNAQELKVLVSGQERVSVQVRRVLPSLLILSEWILSPSGSDLMRSVPSLEPLPNSTIDLDTWGKLAELATNLLKIDDLPLLSKNGDTNTPYQLPELLFTASFLDVFPSITTTFFGDDKDVCSSGLRIGRLLTLCQHLYNMNFLCISFDVGTRVYRKFAKSQDENYASNMEGTSSEKSFYSNLSRTGLLSQEQKKRQQIFVVSPSIVVPDTNVFVDHLDKLKRVVECRRYKVFLCTIVLEELIGLSQAREVVQNSHEIMVTANAKIAVSWLKEIAKEKNNLMGTLTTQGQKIALRLVSEETGDVAGGAINDDRILKACILFAERNPVLDLPASFKLPLNESPAIVRNLVLLSEDRGICIKATTQNIPSRTIQSFMRWAKII